MEPRCVSIVPAAGQGVRMGSSAKKQFLSLGNLPVLAHTLRVLQDCDEIDAIILVVPDEDKTFCEEEIIGKYRIHKVASVVPGGKERQDSVYAGLQAIKNEPELVLVHDGVRPFLTMEMVLQTLKLASQGISAVVGVPVTDTIKSVDANHTVTGTVDRESLWSIQTPQAFPYPVLLKAHESAHKDGFYGTDDASLVERLGRPVHVLMGSHNNIKITSPQDLVLGEAILKDRNNTKSDFISNAADTRR